MIKKLIEFINELNESYENPVDINWIKNDNNNLDGEFYIDDVKYIIECFDWYKNIWSYKFSKIEGDEKIMDLTDDSKRKMRVLSTIRKGMRFLIEEKTPDGLIINVTDSSRGREYLWGRFSKEISDNYEYEILTKKVMGYTTFFLWKEIEFEDMNLAFNKMLRVFQNQ